MFTFNELVGRQPDGVKKTAGTITGRFSIKKADEDKHLAFGWAYVLQNTTFIKTTISKTTAIPTQKPISIPKKDVVPPNRLFQIVAKFIENTSDL